MIQLFVGIYIEYVQVVYAKALEHLNAYTTGKNGIDKESADTEERHRVLELDVISRILQRTKELEQCSEYKAHRNESQEEHHRHCIRPSCLLGVPLQLFLGLVFVAVREVVCEELGQIRENLFALVGCEESVFLDFPKQLLLDDVILELEMRIGEFQEYLLNGNLVNLCIGIKPLEFLINFNEDSAPVCRKL